LHDPSFITNNVCNVCSCRWWRFFSIIIVDAEVVDFAHGLHESPNFIDRQVLWHCPSQQSKTPHKNAKSALNVDANLGMVV